MLHTLEKILYLVDLVLPNDTQSISIDTIHQTFKCLAVPNLQSA